MPRSINNINAEIAQLELLMQSQPIGTVSEDGTTMSLPMWASLTKRLDELYQQADRTTDIAAGTNSRFADRQIMGVGRTSPASNGSQWQFPV